MAELRVSGSDKVVEAERWQGWMGQGNEVDWSRIHHGYTNPIAYIRYAKLIPARQDELIILPASQYMNHHLPASIS